MHNQDNALKERSNHEERVHIKSDSGKFKDFLRKLDEDDDSED